MSTRPVPWVRVRFGGDSHPECHLFGQCGTCVSSPTNTPPAMRDGLPPDLVQLRSTLPIRALVLGIIRALVSSDLLQVVKRTDRVDYPTNTLTNGVVDRPWVFCVVGSNPTSTIINVFRLFPWRTRKILSPVYPGDETAWMIDRSARISGRPGIPPVQERRVL